MVVAVLPDDPVNTKVIGYQYERISVLADPIIPPSNTLLNWIVTIGRAELG